MLLIPCPHCGPRNRTEFTYIGDGSIVRPADGPTSSEDDWFRFVFIRENPKGPHAELWQHTAGCRMVLRVVRDTRSHEIVEVRRLGETREADAP